MRFLRGTKGIIVCLVVLSATLCSVMLLSTNRFIWIINESGPIENATAIAYLLAACWLFSCSYSKRLNHGVSSGLLVLGLALRELDFHVRFTTMGIFKTRYYLSDKVPVPEKIMVSIIVILMIAALIWFVIQCGPAFVRNVRKKYSSAICIVLAIAFACLSKSLDSNSDEIRAVFTNTLHLDVTNLTWAAEEILELGIPLFILLAIHNALGEREN